MTDQPVADLNSRALARAHALAELWQGDQTPITRTAASSMLMEVIQLHGWTQTDATAGRHLSTVQPATVRDAARTASGQQPETTPAPWIADGRHGPTPQEMTAAIRQASAPTCYVEFVGGSHCAKPFGHRPPGSDDPHVPAVGQPAEAQATNRCSSCEHGFDIHDTDGRCWFTVQQGVPERDLVCSCKLRRMAEEARS